MSTYVMGDIHGRHKALLQCLERCGFDKDRDTLIQLGDVADGFYEVFECVEELLKIPNLIAIKGNHDDWLTEFIRTGYHPELWSQGGSATARSYLRLIGKEDLLLRSGYGYKTVLNPGDIPERHQQFFLLQQLYHIDDHNNCYVHGGFNRFQEFKGQAPQVYFWDRELWSAAFMQRYERNFHMVTRFNAIFIGHTSTMKWNTDQPINAFNIYNLDTGCGHSGRLSIMEVESKQVWQSDPAAQLYGKHFAAPR